MEKRTWQYHLIHLLGWFIQLFPYSWLLGMGSFLGGLVYRFSGRHRDRGIDHVMQALHHSEADAKELIRKMYRHMGQLALEVLYSPRLLKSPELMTETISIEVSPAFQEHLDKGQGGILVTAHYGNWEWMAMRIASAGIPLGTIVKLQPQPWVNALLNDNRRDSNVEVYPRTAGGTEILSGIRSIKKGRFLGLLCDQDGGKEGVFIPFLGRMSSTMAGPGIIAAKSGAPIFSTFISRRPEGGHHVQISEELPGSKDPVEMTRMIQKVIEDRIYEKPEEWLWLQRRWNTSVPEKEGANE